MDGSISGTRLAVALLAMASLAAACGGSGGEESAPAEGGADETEPGSEAGGEAAPSSGCGGEAGFAAGFSEQALDTGGEERTYRLLVPEAHDGETPVPVPLLLSLGGYTTNAELQEEISDYEDLGEAEGFVVTTPDPLGNPRAWDTGAGSDDVVFMTDLLDALDEDLCVDRSRVYASGLSLGAIFSSRLACEIGDQLAAIGPVAGLSFFDGCDPGHPMPVLSVHGTDDDLVAFESGERSSVEWAEHNGCASEPVEEQISEHVTARRFEEGCEDAPAELWVVAGGAHSWPGDEFLGGVNPEATTFEIDATEVIWEFLQRFSLASAG